jgi:hypothetical protein
LLAEPIAEGLDQQLEVLCAATVAEGVELLMGAAVDVVLLDCIVPGEATWQIVLEDEPAGRATVLTTGDPVHMKNAASDRGLTSSSPSPCPIRNASWKRWAAGRRREHTAFCRPFRMIVET